MEAIERINTDYFILFYYCVMDIRMIVRFVDREYDVHTQHAAPETWR